MKGESLADLEYILLSPFSYLIEMQKQSKPNRILALKEVERKDIKCFN